MGEFCEPDRWWLRRSSGLREAIGNRSDPRVIGGSATRNGYLRERRRSFLLGPSRPPFPDSGPSAIPASPPSTFTIACLARRWPAWAGIAGRRVASLSGPKRHPYFPRPCALRSFVAVAGQARSHLSRPLNFVQDHWARRPTIRGRFHPSEGALGGSKKLPVHGTFPAFLVCAVVLWSLAKRFPSLGGGPAVGPGSPVGRSLRRPTALWGRPTTLAAGGV